MTNPNDIYPDGSAPLSDRERAVLRLVVKSFIDTAGPVGSRYLAKHSSLGLSSASIRNTMSDLEDLGYLDHPYTSAGRVPTVMGYRAFVNQLMETKQLTPSEKRRLRIRLEQLLGDTEELLRQSSRLLGQLTNLMGVVLTPRLSTGVLERLEVVPLSSTRAMFIISIHGGLVRTIVLHVETQLNRRDLDEVVGLLNERLVGLTLEEIRQTCHERVRDIDDRRTGVVQLVLNETPHLFSDAGEGRRIRVGSTQDILQQPEFQEPSELRCLIELLEDGDTMIHLLEEQRGEDDPSGRAYVTIGSENSAQRIDPDKVDRFSVVTAHYQLGSSVGTVGVIGPTRMDYARVISLVENMAALLNQTND